MNGHPGKAYLDKLLGAGKTRTEALRLLRRRLSDVVFRALLTDEQLSATQDKRHRQGTSAAGGLT